MIAVFYFMLIRPEKERKKEEENLRNSLKVGDRITTIGGIVGKIVELKDENIVIETSADRVRMELARFYVMTNNTAKEAAQKARAEAQAAAKAKAEEKKKQKQQEKENKKKGALISKRRCACPHFQKYVPESAICRLRPFFRIKHPELPTELRNGHLTAYSDAAEGRKAELPSRLTDSGASDIIKMTSVSHKKRQKKRRCCRRGRKS